MSILRLRLRQCNFDPSNATSTILFLSTLQVWDFDIWLFWKRCQFPWFPFFLLFIQMCWFTCKMRWINIDFFILDSNPNISKICQEKVILLIENGIRCKEFLAPGLTFFHPTETLEVLILLLLLRPKTLVVLILLLLLRPETLQVESCCFY